MSGVRRRIAKTGPDAREKPNRRARKTPRPVGIDGGFDASRRVASRGTRRCDARCRARRRAGASAAAARRDAVHAAWNPPSMSAGGKKTLEKSRAASRAAETRRDGARATRERDEEGAGAHRQDSPFGMVLDVAVCVASASQRDRAGARCRSFSLSFSLRPDWREKRVPVRNTSPTGHDPPPPPPSPPPPPVLHAATVPWPTPAASSTPTASSSASSSGGRSSRTGKRARTASGGATRTEASRGAVHRIDGRRRKRSARRGDATTATTTTTTTTTTRDDDDDRHGRRGDLPRDAGHPARPPHPARRLREANAGRARGEDAASDSPGRAVLVASRRVPPGRARGVLARPRRGESTAKREGRGRGRGRTSSSWSTRTRPRRGRRGADTFRARRGRGSTRCGKTAMATRARRPRPRARRVRARAGSRRGLSFFPPPARKSLLFSPPVDPRFRRSVSTLGFDARFRRLRPSTLDTHQGEDAHEEDLSRVPGLLVPYNGPSPPSGHHRYVFVLFEQTDDAEVRADGRGVEEPAACREEALGL